MITPTGTTDFCTCPLIVTSALAYSDRFLAACVQAIDAPLFMQKLGGELLLLNATRIQKGPNSYVSPGTTTSYSSTTVPSTVPRTGGKALHIYNVSIYSHLIRSFSLSGMSLMNDHLHVQTQETALIQGGLSSSAK